MLYEAKYCSFGDIHHSYFPGPGIDILKKLSVYRTKMLKQSTALRARLDWLEGRREQAVERLRITRPRVPYEQVMFAGLLSVYLKELGRIEEAREYADYVIEHGGTLAMREAVLKDWDTTSAEAQIAPDTASSRQ